MRRRGVVSVLIALALALLAPTLAVAQSSSTVQTLEAIRAQMEKGQALVVAGDWAKAAKVFDAGYRAHPYSAFLFNAGVCYQKKGELSEALKRFHKYVRVDANAPDVGKVNERIAGLEAAIAAAVASAEPDGGVAAGGASGDAGAPTDGADAAAVDAGAPRVAPPAIPGSDAMKSLVVIETNPAGAPLRLFYRSQANAPPYQLGAANPGWVQVAATQAPANLTLDVGFYHVVVDRFQSFNVSETDINVASGKVLHFKANLSQGAFMAFLRVSANVRGADIRLDDDAKQHPAWGVTPHGELVTAGRHSVLVEAPGFEPLRTSVDVLQSESKELEVSLVRVGFGILRVDGNAPEIKVRVDDQPVGVWRSGEPPLEVKLTSGQKHLTLTSPGRKQYEGTINVPRGQVVPVHAEMIPTYPRGAAWTQAVIGAVVVGAAVYFGLESDRLHDDLEADRRSGVLETEDDRIKYGRLYAIGANIGFAVGGVLGLLATYNFIKDPLPESSKEVEQPVEFERADPASPTAHRWHARPSSRRRAYRRELNRDPGLTIGPAVGKASGGLLIGGRF